MRVPLLAPDIVSVFGSDGTWQALQAVLEGADRLPSGFRREPCIPRRRRVCLSSSRSFASRAFHNIAAHYLFSFSGTQALLSLLVSPLRSCSNYLLCKCCQRTFLAWICLMTPAMMEPPAFSSA